MSKRKLNVNSKKAKLKKIWENDHNFDPHKASEEIKLNISSIYRYKRDFESSNLANLIEKPKGGGGFEAFREKFDDSLIIPDKIKEGIKKFLVNGKGEPDCMYDQDFREACGIPPSKWRRYADDFKTLQVKKDNLIIWGHPEIIEQMRMVLQR